jgi:predicted DNA-binding protein
MADSKKMTAFRLEESLLKRLDKYAERLSKETGLPATRADVVRLLLMRGLDEAEQLQRKGGR